MGERGRGLTENARRGGSLHRPTARVALGVRPRTRSWCAHYPPARGLGARERRARRRTGPTLVVSAPPAGAGGARVEWHARSDRHEEKKRKRRRLTQRANAISTAAARATRGVRARRARRARVVCRSVRRSLASLEAATTEKTRDKDDDRRQRTGEDHHSGANTPARLRRREPPVVYARAARVARASSVAPCATPSLRSKRRPQKRRETRTTTGDREQEKIITVTNLKLDRCGPERACPPRGRASHEPLTSAMRTSWSSSACDIPVGAHCNQLLGRVVRAAACFAPHAKRILRHEVRRDRDHWGGQGFAISAGLH